MENKIDELIAQLNKTKGFSRKNAERFIFDLIGNKAKIKDFKDIINYIDNNFAECEICFYLSENNVCPICSDNSRNKNKILVVSSIPDAHTIERSNLYNGLYHVLKGEININKNQTPDKLTLENLLQRIDKEKEVILALNSTFEGEVTANFVAQLVKNQTDKVSRIAKGMPVGGMLDYIDNLTLKSAINNREKYED
ncbi:recombination mediator RecR [Spiroplasma alleghenense]|uniref:Recombination protein RecR n=1 Tax=Spiroplasma alleghenense TaxID=216931 RepID=A0A345Z255_9MOLU|nr:recombination mediator RecR [Spiroplasma alleghenense]AXK50684.1 recombination protein RecR [Spiroplasma alleghenense]